MTGKGLGIILKGGKGKGAKGKDKGKGALVKEQGSISSSMKKSSKKKESKSRSESESKIDHFAKGKGYHYHPHLYTKGKGAKGKSMSESESKIGDFAKGKGYHYHPHLYTKGKGAKGKGKGTRGKGKGAKGKGAKGKGVMKPTCAPIQITTPPSPTTQDFISRAFIPGLQHEKTNGNETVLSDQGIEFEISANLTTRKSGIISLADVEDLIKSISCDSSEPFPTITIAFHNVLSFGPRDIQAMFPKDAVLVVNKDTFGVCFKSTIADSEGFTDVFSDADLYRHMIDTGDGYLVVDSAALAASNVVVTGERGYFFSMFEEGHLSIREAEDQKRRELISIQVEQRYKPFRFMELNILGIISSNPRITLIDSDFGWWGFEMLVRITVDASVELKIDMPIEKGREKPLRIWQKQLLSRGVGPPPVQILNLLRKLSLLGNFAKIPDLKVGLYLELVLSLKLFDILLSADFGPYFDAEYTFGQKQADISIIFKPFSGDVNIDADLNENLSGAGWKVQFGIKPLEFNGAFKLSAFFSLHPQFMLYVTEFIGAGIGLETGAELETRTEIIGAMEPLEPMAPIIFVGPCETCHNFQGDLSLVTYGPKFQAFVKVPPPINLTKWWKKDLLGGDVSLREKVMTLCMWKQFDEDTITCNKDCCDGSYQVCQSGMCVDDDDKLCDPLCTAGIDICCSGSCISADECCPACTGTDTCCAGSCVRENECCSPACTGTDTCCDGVCVTSDDCCPVCLGSEICCNGSCVSSECCGSDDPCCDSDDPCCDSDDPCCDSDDPCCDSDDPCCGTEDPCCESDCYEGGANGDPHLVTFDNFLYSCQAKGEFVTFQSLIPGAQVQSRFEKNSNFVSLVTGIAAVGGPRSKVIQLSIPKSDPNALNLFVERKAISVDPFSGYEDAEILVTERDQMFTIFFKETKMSVIVRYITIISFRHLSVHVRLPDTLRGEDIRGLLGSPDDDASNDWTAFNGTYLSLPTADSDSRGEAAYNYCTEHWCIRNRSQSLFFYEGEFDFDFFSGCDDPFPGDVDLSRASPELQALCGNDQACLIDGIELGLDGARSLLETEADVSSTSASARFRAAPTAIVVNVSANVALTVNLANISMTDVRNIEEFLVYRVDSQTLQLRRPAITTLRDAGLGVGMDTVAGDFIFSNILATISNTPGQSFSFRAVPIIGGVEDNASPFVVTALNAVRSYSREAGIGGNNTDSIRIINVSTVKGLILVIEYSWPADQRDLDTGTQFLSSTVGYACGQSSPYMEFDGDKTGLGQTETVRVYLGASFNDTKWVDWVSVNLNAGWHGSTDRGPASVMAYTKRDFDNGTIVEGNNAETFVITPGSQNGCASTAVGVAQVLVGSNGTVTIKLIPAVA